MERQIRQKRDKRAGLQRAVMRLLLCVCLVVPVFVQPTATAEGKETPATVTFSQLNDPSVFLKQSQPHVCTLTASAMMIRRAAMLDGSAEWEKITESSVRRTAWVEGTGIKWQFSSAGISVVHKYLSSKSELIKLLDKHPEGIVAYNPGKPHAILITDYTDGVFYCSDPSNGSPSGRYPVAESSMTVESVSRIWYVKSPSNLSVVRDDLPYETDGLQYKITNFKKKTVACTGMTDNSTSVVIPDEVKIDGVRYSVTAIAEGAFSGKSKLKSVVVGSNVTEIGRDAFAKCKKLKTVTILSSVLKSVGENAFASIYKKAQIKADGLTEECTALLAAAAPPTVVIIKAADDPGGATEDLEDAPADEGV